MVSIDLQTSSGPARADWYPVDRPSGLLVLGPGASGAVGAADLRAVRDATVVHGLAVAVVEPAYRVAGRTVPPRGSAVDVAWRECVEQVRALAPGGVALVTGGRSFGSRVACRTAHEVGAVGVLCLAYPLHPPGKPERSRADELAAAEPLPVLVVQGERDPFGRPGPGPGREVVVVSGDHSLKKDLPAVTSTVVEWLSRTLPAAQ